MSVYRSLTSLLWLLLPLIAMAVSESFQAPQLVLGDKQQALYQKDYPFTIISPLARYIRPMQGFLSQVHPDPQDFGRSKNDSNVYLWGRYKDVNVQIIGLQEGSYVDGLFAVKGTYSRAPKESLFLVVGEHASKQEWSSLVNFPTEPTVGRYQLQKPLIFLAVIDTDDKDGAKLTAKVIVVEDDVYGDENPNYPMFLSMEAALLSDIHTGYGARRFVTHFCGESLNNFNGTAYCTSTGDTLHGGYCQTYFMYHADHVASSSDMKEYLLQLLRPKGHRSFVLPDSWNDIIYLDLHDYDDEGNLRNHSTLQWKDPLYHSCAFGFDGLVQLLLEDSTKINEAHGGRGTPLQAAAYYGQHKVLDTLLASGADPNVDKTGSRASLTPLINAINHGDIRMVKALLESGADASLCGWRSHGYSITPLVAAVKTGKLEIVDTILKNNASINNKDVPGSAGNAIWTAAIYGHYAILRLLVSHGKFFGIEDKSRALGDALAQVAMNGAGDLVKLLLEEGASTAPSAERFGSALAGASNMGWSEMVETLLEYGADPHLDEIGRHNALISASGYQAPDDVRRRTSRGEMAPRFAQDNTILIKKFLLAGPIAKQILTEALFASCGYRLDVVKILLENGADPNGMTADGRSPLLIAIRHQRTDIVRFLLENGAIVTPFSSEKASPEHCPFRSAIRWGDEKLLKLLIEHGGSLDSMKHYFETEALYFAANWGYLGIVKLILKAGVNVNVSYNNLGFPLQAAVENHHQEIALTLIEAGADSNLYTDKRLTALQLAAKQGSEILVDSMLEHGANPNICVRYHESALSLASGMATNASYVEVVRRLLTADADIELSCEMSHPALVAAAGSKGQYAQEIVTILLENGANITQASVFGATAMETAALAGNEWFVKLAVEQNLHNKPSELFGTVGRNALDWAAESGHRSIVDLLDTNGVSLGSSAKRIFCSAASSGHLDVVEWFIGKRIHLGHAGLKKGFLCAISQNQEKIVELFIRERTVDLTGEIGSELLFESSRRKNGNISKMLRGAGARRRKTHDEL